MRLLALLLLAVSVPAAAQVRQGEVLATASSAPASALAPLPPAETVPDDAPAPLAQARRDQRIPSKNQAYNQARAAEGRLGLRLGDDESHRITGN